MKRAYLYEGEPRAEQFKIIDGVFTWYLGDGIYQAICDEESKPDWLVEAKDIRVAAEEASEKVASVCVARKAECSLMKASVAVVKGGVEEVAAPDILPLFVMMGDCPEDIVKQDEEGIVSEELILEKP